MCDLQESSLRFNSQLLYSPSARAVASLVGLAPRGSSLAAASLSDASADSNGGQHVCRALCVGLGGGTLPLFLTHHFPNLHIDVVELDPVVLRAAEEAMGFPKDRLADFTSQFISPCSLNFHLIDPHWHQSTRP